MGTLIVATRRGKLAIAQTEIVISALRTIHPNIQIKIRKISTRGDRDKRTVLWKLKKSGFFTSLVEDALLAGKADFAVHSFKDLPTQQRKGLAIAAVCDRQFAEDCLISAKPISSIEELPKEAKIGTSSLRRAVQIKRLRGDLQVLPMRGNVPTRIKKLEKGEFHAVILARAGVERLGLADRISFGFDPTQFIPAPAQGALAVQARTDDKDLRKQVSAIDDKKARIATFAERKVLATMQCGCHAPAGAFAKVVGDNIEISAFVSDLQSENFISRQIAGPIKDAESLADQIASELLVSGGMEILENLER